MNGEKRVRLVWKHIEVEMCGLEVPKYFYGGHLQPTLMYMSQKWMDSQGQKNTDLRILIIYNGYNYENK